MESNILQFSPRAEPVEPAVPEVLSASYVTDATITSITGLHGYATSRRELSKPESEITTKLRAVFNTMIEEYPDLKELLEPMLDCKISDVEHGLTPMANLYTVFHEELIAEVSLYDRADETA